MDENMLVLKNINVEFDYVMMNYYRNDDDEAVEEGKNVAIDISLGTPRPFKMVHRKRRYTIKLANLTEN